MSKTSETSDNQSNNQLTLDKNGDVQEVSSAESEEDLYLEGYCPDCNNKMQSKEEKELYRCSNCYTMHTEERILNIKH